MVLRKIQEGMERRRVERRVERRGELRAQILKAREEGEKEGYAKGFSKAATYSLAAVATGVGATFAWKALSSDGPPPPNTLSPEQLNPPPVSVPADTNYRDAETARIKKAVDDAKENPGETYAQRMDREAEEARKKETDGKRR